MTVGRCSGRREVIVPPACVNAMHRCIAARNNAFIFLLWRSNRVRLGWAGSKEGDKKLSLLIEFDVEVAWNVTTYRASNDICGQYEN
jgi:hypothetical protein